MQCLAYTVANFRRFICIFKKYFLVKREIRAAKLLAWTVVGI